MSGKREMRLLAATKKRHVRQAASVRASSTIEGLESRTLMAAAPAVVAPSHVIVTPVADDQLSVTWTDNSADETQFMLDRAAGGGRFTPLATLPAGSTGFTDNGLVPSTLYRYRVRAANDAGVSKWAGRGGTTAPWVINAAARHGGSSRSVRVVSAARHAR